MSIQHPHVLNVKFCKHHSRVGTTDKIADFLYGCVVPLEEAGIDVIKAGLACGCTVWMRHNEKRALPAAPPTVGSGTPAAGVVGLKVDENLGKNLARTRRTKGRALHPVCNCHERRERRLTPLDCPVHGAWLADWN